MGNESKLLFGATTDAPIKHAWISGSDKAPAGRSITVVKVCEEMSKNEKETQERPLHSEMF